MQREVRDIREVESVFGYWLNIEPGWRNRKGLLHQLGQIHKCIMEPSQESFAAVNIFWERPLQITRSFLHPSLFGFFLPEDFLRAALCLLHAENQTSHDHAEKPSRSSTAGEMTFYSLCTLRCVCVYVCDRFIGVIYPAQRASVVRNGGLSARRSLLLCSLYGLH